VTAVETGTGILNVTVISFVPEGYASVMESVLVSVTLVVMVPKPSIVPVTSYVPSTVVEKELHATGTAAVVPL